MKYIFLIVFLVHSMRGQSWDDVKNAVYGTGCLVTVSPKLTRDCLKAFDEELESRPKDEKDNKAICCAFLRLQSCAVDISKKDCGEEGESVAKTFLKQINRGITSDECIDYGFITCITLIQIAIVAVIALALMALLSCICCCCCRSKRRSGRAV